MLILTLTKSAQKISKRNARLKAKTRHAPSIKPEI
jgi:hypothetical protein